MCKPINIKKRGLQHIKLLYKGLSLYRFLIIPYIEHMALLHLSHFTSLTFLSSPETADTCRAELEQMLVYHKKIEIDFSNVHVTQGFMRHLLEPLFLKRGLILFDRLFFANCSESVELTINEVIKHYRETCQPMH